MLPKQRIVLRRRCEQQLCRRFVERSLRNELLPSQAIDSPIRRHPPQPEHEVLVRLERAHASIHLQKHLLRQIFGKRPVQQHAQGNAVNQRLMQPDERSEARGAAGTRTGKRIFRLAWLEGSQ